jgi:hypothetical protein
MKERLSRLESKIRPVVPRQPVSEYAQLADGGYRDEQSGETISEAELARRINDWQPPQGYVGGPASIRFIITELALGRIE